MFLDRESGTVVPLCNKPDCKHESEDLDCNACFREVQDIRSADSELDGDGMIHEYLQYYEGSLYAVGCDSEGYAALYRIKPDGSGEWEECTRLYRTDFSSTGRWETPDVFIDNGRVYYADSAQENEKLQSVGIDGEDPEIIFEGEAEMVNLVYRMKSRGGYLYYQVMTYEGDDYENYQGGLYQYDPSTGESRMVKEQLIVPYSVRGDFVYYGNEDGLCCYSMKDQSTKVLADKSMQVPYITLTEDYIAVFDSNAGNELTLYDYTGNEIASINAPELWMCWGGDSSMLFGQGKGEISSGWKVLNLEDVGEDLQWKSL